MNPHTNKLIEACQQFYAYHNNRGNAARACYWITVYMGVITAHAQEIDAACEAVWND